MKREFMVLAKDAIVYDYEDNYFYYPVVVDSISEDDPKKVQALVERNFAEQKYGNFKDYEIIEKRNMSHKNGIYILLIAPSGDDFIDLPIEDTMVLCFDDKRNALIEGIEAIEHEFVILEELDKEIGTAIKMSSTLLKFMNLKNENLKNICLRDKLVLLNDDELLKLWLQMKNEQFEKNVNYHCAIKVEGKSISSLEL